MNTMHNGHSVSEWEQLLREGADSFIAWAADLPPGERAEALRHGRDALANKAVELAGAEAARPLGSVPVIGQPLGTAGG